MMVSLSGCIYDDSCGPSQRELHLGNTGPYELQITMYLSDTTDGHQWAGWDLDSAMLVGHVRGLHLIDSTDQVTILTMPVTDIGLHVSSGMTDPYTWTMDEGWNVPFDDARARLRTGDGHLVIDSDLSVDPIEVVLKVSFETDYHQASCG